MKRTKLKIELPLPEISGSVPDSSIFRQHIANAITDFVRRSCSDAWIRNECVKYLKTRELERRKAFRSSIENLKGGNSEKPAENCGLPPARQTPASAAVNSSKKAPVATNDDNETA